MLLAAKDHVESDWLDYGLDYLFFQLNSLIKEPTTLRYRLTCPALNRIYLITAQTEKDTDILKVKIA